MFKRAAIFLQCFVFAATLAVLAIASASAAGPVDARLPAVTAGAVAQPVASKMAEAAATAAGSNAGRHTGAPGGGRPDDTAEAEPDSDGDAPDFTADTTDSEVVAVSTGALPDTVLALPAQRSLGPLVPPPRPRSTR